MTASQFYRQAVANVLAALAMLDTQEQTLQAQCAAGQSTIDTTRAGLQATLAQLQAALAALPPNA